MVFGVFIIKIVWGDKVIKKVWFFKLLFNKIIFLLFLIVKVILEVVFIFIL